MLIGEIISRFDHRDQIIPDRFFGETVPFRKVRWIDTSTEKRHFSKAFSRATENRHAIIEIDAKSILAQSALKREIYAKAYDNYVWADVTKVSFFGRKYEPQKVRKLIAATKLIEFLNRKYEETMEVSPDHLDEFSFEFHSPGKIDLRTISYGALAIAVAVAAIGASSYREAKKGITLTMESQDAATDVVEHCTEFFDNLMNSITEEQFDELKAECEAAKEIGLSASVKKTNVPSTPAKKS